MPANYSQVFCELNYKRENKNEKNKCAKMLKFGWSGLRVCGKY